MTASGSMFPLAAPKPFLLPSPAFLSFVSFCQVLLQNARRPPQPPRGVGRGSFERRRRRIPTSSHRYLAPSPSEPSQAAVKRTPASSARRRRGEALRVRSSNADSSFGSATDNSNVVRGAEEARGDAQGGGEAGREGEEGSGREGGCRGDEVRPSRRLGARTTAQPRDEGDRRSGRRTRS